MVNKLKYLLVLPLLLFINICKGNNESEKFTPGEFIMEHIGDAYEFHIISHKNFHLSIPLPVIIYSENSGMNIFMSNKFHNEHKSYQNFKIADIGENKGKIVEVGKLGKEIVPLDLSFTKNVFSIFVSVILLLIIFVKIANRYKKNGYSAPKKMQSLLEPIILFVRDDIAKPAIGEKHHLKYMPYLLTVFFFIFINNLIGLFPVFPGGANVTGNISITLVLALITFVITLFSTNKGFWVHIFNAPGVPWWLKIPVPLMPVVELIGIFTKPFVLMVRLFANITAGHIIVLGFLSLIFIFGSKNIFAGYGVSVISIAFAVFMGILEILVAFIQAYVFTLLSAIYFGMAKVEEHH